MGFQEYVEQTDLEKIERYLKYLGFVNLSHKTSTKKVYAKDDISVFISIIEE